MSATHRPGREADLASGREQDLARCLLGEVAVTPARLARLRGQADASGVLPLLLDRAAGDDADSAGASLRDRLLQAAALEARRGAVLAQALQALARAGIPNLVFKGGALAHQLYPRPELRPRDDTDLLVPAAHREAAHRILVDAGFVHVPGVEGERILRQRLYRRDDADGLLHNLDVHWRVTNEARGDAFDARELMSRAVRLPAGGVDLLVPCAVDALLLACLHLDAHHAGHTRLIWFYDIHLLLESMDDVTREHTAERIRALELTAPCAWVLTRTQALFRTPLGPLRAVVAGGSHGEPSAHRMALWWRDLCHQPDAAARMRWLWQHLFPPLDQIRHRWPAQVPDWQLHARRAARGLARALRR